MGGSPSGFTRTSSSRPSSIPRKSGEGIPGITEEDEEELELEDDEVEDVDHFGPELIPPSSVDLAVDEPYTEPVSPLSPLPPTDEDEAGGSRSGSVPLTAEALAQKQAEEEKLEAFGPRSV
jgi:hypothetical protein